MPQHTLLDLSRSIYSSAKAAKRLLVRGALHAVPDTRLTPLQKWRRDGENQRRTNGLGLRECDVALDFGGYRGDYVASLRSRYNCTVHVFEPVPDFAQDLELSFADDVKVHVHRFAVGHTSGTMSLHVEADASGAFARGPGVDVEIVAAKRIAEIIPGPIALAKVNIEGGEYDLIPALHEAGILARINRLFVQFHDISESSGQDRRACQQILELTHRCDWDYPFVWESWMARQIQVVTTQR